MSMTLSVDPSLSSWVNWFQPSFRSRLKPFIPLPGEHVQKPSLVTATKGLTAHSLEISRAGMLVPVHRYSHSDLVYICSERAQALLCVMQALEEGGQRETCLAPGHLVVVPSGTAHLVYCYPNEHKPGGCIVRVITAPPVDDEHVVWEVEAQEILRAQTAQV